MDLTHRHQKALTFLQSSYTLDSYSLMCVAICLMVTKDYQKTLATFNGLYQVNSRKEFSQIGYFLKSSLIEKVVELFILANEPVQHWPQVQNLMGIYQKDIRGNALQAQYAYILFYLLEKNEANSSDLVHQLQKKTLKRYKDLHYIAQTAQAILDQDKAQFELSLAHLLNNHEYMATRGILKNTPEGFFCLSAMSLAQIAYQRGLISDFNQINSTYFEANYLQFLNHPC